MERMGFWDYLGFVLGIGPTDVVYRWVGDDFEVSQKCLVTGRTVRVFLVECEWSTRPEDLVMLEKVSEDPQG